MEDRTLTATPYDDRQDLTELARKLLGDAWRKGRDARRAGREFRCTLSNYMGPKVRQAWEEGWSAAHAELEAARRPETRVPELKTQIPPVRRRG